MLMGTFQATHHHFIDRIQVCLKRLCASLEPNGNGVQECSLEGASFLTLLDNLLDSLSVLTNPSEDTRIAQEDILVLGKQTKIDLLLGQALSFANVALQQDKKALSALCQKVLQCFSTYI